MVGNIQKDKIVRFTDDFSELMILCKANNVFKGILLVGTVPLPKLYVTHLASYNSYFIDGLTSHLFRGYGQH